MVLGKLLGLWYGLWCGGVGDLGCIRSGRLVGRILGWGLVGLVLVGLFGWLVVGLGSWF